MAKLIATFAAGCFWGVEHAFRALPGVVSTRVGYTGGHASNPTYEQVCTGATSHAEAVEVEYDDERTSYADLLATFFSIHDPTQVDRQGPDFGSQYRSAIFFHSEEQKRQAEEAKEQRERSGAHFGQPIATSIEPAGIFWPAEEYHQRYFERRGSMGCGISKQPG